MDDLELKYFEALSRDRSESADMLEKPSMRGIKNSVVEKYSDQAHFIYELIQNADDAKATKVRFILENNYLIFAHNGTRRFSVTNPETEDQDSSSGKLGDINAITSIANSNKTKASIGKFGVGFKAVFQYTDTPYIFDPTYHFRIDRFIVPTLLNEDHPERKNDETLFLFPFNHENKNSITAFEDIKRKLYSLTYPNLFLENLEKVEFKINEAVGLYEKKITNKQYFEDTTAENITLKSQFDHELHEENIWLFTRRDMNDRRYSVGYFLDDDKKLKPVKRTAFCFFPTKEVTNLNFIIHAPFLLTDSREGIRAGQLYNEEMIHLLSGLAADSIMYMRDIENDNIRLIDDNILSIIPIDENLFTDVEDKQVISFKPFYTNIRQIFENESIIPTEDGYTTSKNAYWASSVQLPKLFSNYQLSEICANPEAKWVFTSIGRDEALRNKNVLFDYIESIIRTGLNEDVILNGRKRDFYYNRIEKRMVRVESIKGITQRFIESQSFQWLYKFYKWLSETKHRTEIILTKPIFLNQYKIATAAFDKKKQPILFLPTDTSDDYNIVHPQLLDDVPTREFIELVGIKVPSLKDQIYNVILPKYRRQEDVDSKLYFLKFYEYYCQCSMEEAEKFVKLLKGYSFLEYTCERTCEKRFEFAEELYMPTEELKNFFCNNLDIKFINIDLYNEWINSVDNRMLISFLKDLGVHYLPRKIKDEKHYIENGLYTWETEYLIEGLNQNLENIAKTQSFSESTLIWDKMCRLISRGILDDSILSINVQTRKDGRYKWRSNYKDSTSKEFLLNLSWLVDNKDNFVSPASCSVNQLSVRYNLQEPGVDTLIKMLCLDVPKESEENFSNLTEIQRTQINFAKRCEELNLTIDDLEEFAQQKKIRNLKKEKQENKTITAKNNLKQTNRKEFFQEKAQRDIKEIIKNDYKKTNQKAKKYDDFIDEDEFIPAVINYDLKIERAKQKSALEIDRIAYLEELQDKVLQLDKYTYAWFNELLKMESITNTDSKYNSKEISISFSEVEKEFGTNRTLILKHPNRYIPHFMEDLGDIPLILHMKDTTKTLSIEVANIKSYTLRVKLKNTSNIDGIDLDEVMAATIDAKSPSFLLDELTKQFSELSYEDNFNMQTNLCDNIKFIFGPPGTGKTTYLAKEVLIPLMKQNENYKVLVLTPTNKSADVLIRKIMAISDDRDSYKDWLVRFGTTGDEKIEQSEILKDRTFNIEAMSKNVTVTTIARFPYDYFMHENSRNFLYNMPWDYIVVDEASMIPLVNIVFLLYKKKPKQFIIAGDPFQIEPITAVDLWKNENIYSMVNLKSFTNTSTIPHQYEVKLLTTQYRSVPEIGQIFSQFTYGGILKHNRSIVGQKSLNLPDNLGVKTLNIIKFPVSKYESIYRAKKLNHSSSYQVYSALFTYEYVNYLAHVIANNNPNKLFSIGIIAPYRAQADIIDKLLAAEIFPKEISIQVGTIHGFQGDECDIIFTVFNPPPKITSSKEMFLNKKNIINVSISRAKDYLFIIMPDDETENVENLYLIKQIESLIKCTNEWNEISSPILENLMFNDSKYLENNAFSTSHQNVNVYGLPEKSYEIRTEESAVDIQIHKDNITNQ